MIDETAEKVLAKFVADRQEKLDAEFEKNKAIDERSGDNGVNPPAVRATDGGKPGTIEKNPLKLAAEADAEMATDEDDSDEPVNASKAAIAHAKANGIDINTVTGTGKDGAITKGDVQSVIDDNGNE